MDIDKIIKDLEKEGYTEVGSSVNETWDFKKNPQFKGVFVEVRQGIGQNNSNLYVFEGEDQKKYGIWGSAVLDVRLKNLVVGEEVVIIYAGTTKSEKTGRTYKDFRVYHKGGSEEPPLPEEEDMPISNEYSTEERG